MSELGLIGDGLYILDSWNAALHHREFVGVSDGQDCRALLIDKMISMLSHSVFFSPH
jgi:hypothetical protein